VGAYAPDKVEDERGYHDLILLVDWISVRGSCVLRQFSVRGGSWAGKKYYVSPPSPDRVGHVHKESAFRGEFDDGKNGWKVRVG